MTSLDENGVTVAALGPQAQSQRKSAPSYGISKVGRDARERVFITEHHIKPNRTGRESPVRDTINLPSTLNKQPAIKFAASGRGKKLPGEKHDDPGDYPTNDALDVVPDSQPYKYRNEPQILMGTEPRGRLKDAFLMKAHSAAFFARDSPGPAAIGEEFGPDYKVVKPRQACAVPFGVKTKIKPDAWQVNFNPEEVGPGLYPVRDTSLGQQHLTARRNQAVHAFSKAPKFPKTKSDSVISKLGPPNSSFGHQPLDKNRSEPAIHFNCDTRATRDRTQVCRTKLDLGPTAKMPKQTFFIPTLPPERVILASGFG